MALRYKYSVKDGDLVIRDEKNNLIWRGKPKGSHVISAFALPSSDDAIVLLDWKEAFISREKNLIRVGPKGEIKWEVREPVANGEIYGIDRKGDTYVRIFKIEGSNLFANSFSGFLDEIDIETGQVRKSTFVK